MENCDAPVKITVGGREWYYQKFYGENGKVSCVRLYDGTGDFVREYSNIYRLTGSLGAMVRREKEAVAKKAAGVVIEKRETAGITEEERVYAKKIVVERLNELRDGMTVTEFANKVGLTADTVGGYLRGDKMPQIVYLKRIADRFGVSADWIIGRTDAR